VKKITFLFCFFSILVIVKAQNYNYNWQPVGPNNTNEVSFLAGSASIVLSKSEILYTAYEDTINGNRISVKALNGTTWTYVGQPGFSAGRATTVGIVMDQNNIPYVVYSDGSVAQKISVMKYNGSSWVYVGPAGFSDAGTDYPSIAVDTTNNYIYVAYSDQYRGDKITVLRYNGTQWDTVGHAGFSHGVADFSSIYVDKFGTPYVEFTDEGNHYDATIMKFTGTTWDTVGMAGLSLGLQHAQFGLSPSGTPYALAFIPPNLYQYSLFKFNGTAWTVISPNFTPSLTGGVLLAFNALDTPFVMCHLIANNSQVNMMKYMGSGWDTVSKWEPVGAISSSYDYLIAKSGNMYISYLDNGNFQEILRCKTTNWDFLSSVGITNDSTYTGRATGNQIAIDNWGTPYILYLLPGDTFKVEVKKYVGSAWVDLGAVGYNYDANLGIYDSPIIAIDKSGTPYVAFADINNGNKATIKKYNGSSWVNVGTPGFSSVVPEFMSIAFDTASIPYFAFVHSTANAYVMKFNGSSWVNVGSISSIASTAQCTSITITSKDTIYVAYDNYSTNGLANVVKYNGTSWQSVGPPDFSAYTAVEMSLCHDSKDSLYLAYQDASLSYKATVVKYRHGTWVPLGGAGFSTNYASIGALVIDTANRPYIAYNNGGNNVVQSFNGITWQTTNTIGDLGFGGIDIATNSSGKIDAIYSSLGSFVKTVSVSLTISTNILSNVSCNGGNNGKASATVVGGHPPYTFSWSGGAGTDNIATGLSAGTYTITVDDSLGSTATASVTVGLPSLLQVSVTATNFTCANNKGNATALVSGGSPPYTYTWSDANSQTTSIATGLSAGTYTASVIDICGNTVTASAKVSSDTLNFGFINNTLQRYVVPAGIDSITITAVGGKGGVTSATVLRTGGLGASLTGTLAVTPGHVLMILIGGAGGYGTNDGGGGGGGTFVWDSNTNALLVAAGGGGGAGYSLGGANGQISNTSASTLEAANMATGAGAGGTGGNGGIAGVTSHFGAACAGAGWLSNGGILSAGTRFYAGGGIFPENLTTPGYGGVGYNNIGLGGYGGGAGGGYNGGGGGGGYNGGGGGKAIATGGNGGSGGGSYFNGTIASSTTTGTLIDSNGSVIITSLCNNNLTITTTVNRNASACANIGAASVNITSGTSPFTFLWSPGGQTNNTATGLSAGTYTVTVHDNNNSTATASVTIMQLGTINAMANTTTNVSCNGGNNGSATANVTGGTTPYTYSWNTSPVQTNALVTGLSAGTYTVTVNDSNNCSSSASVTITQPLALTATRDSVDASATCTGIAVVIPNGGTAPYTYLWAPGTQTTDSIKNQCAGTYTCTITDANNCTLTTSVTINTCTNLYNEPICIVTIDTTNNKSKVIWGRTNSPPNGGSGSYNIYKYNGSSYVLLHSQPLDSLSEFVDASSNPSAAAQSYELSTTDSCGESALSAPHTSILLTTFASTNAYNLSWTPYIGFTPVRYRIFRGPSMSSLVQIDSVANTVFSYVDSFSPVNVYYVLEAVNPATTCIPTHRFDRYNPTPFLSGSFSNGFNTAILSVNNLSAIANSINVYPNPTNNILNIQMPQPIDGTLSISNVLGQEVYEGKMAGNSSLTQVSIGNLPQGIYLLKIESSNQTVVKRIVKL